MSHDDAKCPSCGEPASLANPSGGVEWRFRCRPCDLSWGHPQSISREDASGSLFDLREFNRNGFKDKV